ncbi:MAG: M56 family metallopeptidase [Vicinamibacterales bacterium]
MTPWISVTGWALIHFLWQGALVTVATAIALRVTSRRSSATRYAVACAGLLAMLAAPPATAALFLVPHTTATLDRVASGFQDATPGTQPSTPNTGKPPGDTAPPVTADARSARPWLAMIVALWLAGVFLLFGRFAGGCWRVRRLRTRALSEGLCQWQATGERIARRLRLHAAVRVVQSTAVEGPCAIGWLRPVIVLPVAALANLSPSQVEAILAHELAHIRRCDYAVNLLQTVVETLLFYHPGVWWVSARIRQEREHCCDDVAVEICGEPRMYAEALAELGSWRTPASILAPGAAHGSLLVRIRRLMKDPADDPRLSPGGLVALALAITVGGASALQSSAYAGHGTSASVSGGSSAASLGQATRQTSKTDHFTIHFPATLDLHAERVAVEAERAYERVSSDLKHNLAFVVPILLFRTRQELEQSASVSQPDDAAGSSRDRILLAVDVPADQWRGLITHEVAHVFGADIVPGMKAPRWIMEGLAEYERGDWDPSDLAAIRDMVHGGSVPSASDLDRGNGLDSRVLSTLGHAAFDFIESRWGKNGVRQFLFALRRAALEGIDPYSQAFRVSREEFTEGVVQHLRSRFASTGARAASVRFDEDATLHIQGEVTSINVAAVEGLACLELWVDAGTVRQRWAVECAGEPARHAMRAMRPGDWIVVTGAPARHPARQRVMVHSLVRPADGFTWKTAAG